VLALKGGDPRNGPITLHDNEIGSASDIHMSKCFEGFVNYSDTDLKLHNISGYAIRGAGLHLRGAATQVTGWQHFYGCETGILIGKHPDEGPIDAIPNYLGGVTQCESCKYGVRNRYGLSTMSEFRGYNNTGIALWIEESMAVGKVNINVTDSNAVGIQIDGEATDSQINSGHVDTTGTGATGIVVRADRSQLNLHTSGSSQALLIEGDTDNLLVDDCSITLMNGHAGDIAISDLGDGNRITIVNAAVNQDADVTITEIGTANEIRIINRGTGTVTLPASWDDDPADGVRNLITINGVEQSSP
jgi:hypothetical protein